MANINYFGAPGESLEDAEAKYGLIKAKVIDARPALDWLKGDHRQKMFNLRVYWFDAEKGSLEDKSSHRDLTLDSFLFDEHSREVVNAFNESGNASGPKEWKGLDFLIFHTHEVPRQVVGLGIYNN